jgi:hypothetical protein
MVRGMISVLRPIVLLVLLSCAGCKSMGGGVPAGQAQVTVTGVQESQIEDKAEEVFYRYGFDFKGQADGRMEFERAGGVMDTVLYGNWQEKDMVSRVTLYIIPKGDSTYALRTRALAVRRSFGGDEDTQLFDVQGGKYGAILKKIAQELRNESQG